MKKGNQEQDKKNLGKCCLWALKSFSGSAPVILGVILLMGLFQNFVSGRILYSLFNGVIPRDTLVGALMGSLSAGNAISSYIIGAELLKRGISLFAVIAFVITWVTVGIAQMPAEAGILGKRFAIARNALSFLMAILISLATTITWMALS